MERTGPARTPGWPGHQAWWGGPGEELARIAQSARRLSEARAAIDAWAGRIDEASGLAALVREGAAAVDNAVAAAEALVASVGLRPMPGGADARAGRAVIGSSSALHPVPVEHSRVPCR